MIGSVSVRETSSARGWMLEDEQEFTWEKGGDGISGRWNSMSQHPAVVPGSSPGTQGGEESGGGMDGEPGRGIGDAPESLIFILATMGSHRGHQSA